MLPKVDPSNPKACMSLIEDMTTNVKQIQDSLLEAILSRNAKIKYLRGFLNGQVDKQSFKENLPVVTYEDYRSYIDCIANGAPSEIICDRPITVLLTSSGTSGGVPKLNENSNSFLKVLKFLEDHWSELCSNIRIGRLSDWITDPQCASGISVNVNPLCKPCDVSYTIMPSMRYFEFLEVEKEHQETSQNPLENPAVVDLVDFKVGHDYEPVIPTFSGLYRYRLGYVLRVSDFYNNAPQFYFVGRQKVILSIDMDKTYEEDLLKAVTNAKLLLEPHDLMLVDFTSRVDSSSFPGHYVLYWELGSKFKDAKLKLDPNVLEECCFTIEESFDAVYRKGRKNDKNIGPLEIQVVRPGAFDKLMNFFLSRGSSVS